MTIEWGSLGAALTIVGSIWILIGIGLVTIKYPSPGWPIFWVGIMLISVGLIVIGFSTKPGESDNDSLTDWDGENE